jgi:hypothetical protein
MEISRVGEDLVVEIHNQERAIIKIRSESLERDGEISGAVILCREDVEALRDALERAEHVADRMERQAEDTGLICALCGGPIRTTLAADWVRACHSCGIEEGPMLPADDTGETLASRADGSPPPSQGWGGRA